MRPFLPAAALAVLALTAACRGPDTSSSVSAPSAPSREGADVAIVYLSEDEDAEETRQAIEAEGRGDDRAGALEGSKQLLDYASTKGAIRAVVRVPGRPGVLQLHHGRGAARGRRRRGWVSPAACASVV